MATAAQSGLRAGWANAVRPGHKAYAFGITTAHPKDVSPAGLDNLLIKYSKNPDAVCIMETSPCQMRPFSCDSLAGVKSPIFQNALRTLDTQAEAFADIKVRTNWYFTLVTLPECLSIHARTRALRYLKSNAHCLLRRNYGVRQDEAERGVRAMPIHADQNYVLVATDCHQVAGRHRAVLHSLSESPTFRKLLSPPPAKPITFRVQSTDNNYVPPSWEAISAALEPYGALQKMQRGCEGIITVLCSPRDRFPQPPAYPCRPVYDGGLE